MRLIPLTRGYFAQVSDADYEWLSSFKWCAMVTKYNVYAKRMIMKNGRKSMVTMHRFIMGDGPAVIDHADGNGLNNQRENVRPATASQNVANGKLRRTNTSGFKGVTWQSQNCNWNARIVVRGKCLSLGCYQKKEDAGAAYIKAAKEHFGEFARER